MTNHPLAPYALIALLFAASLASVILGRRRKPRDPHERDRRPEATAAIARVLSARADPHLMSALREIAEQIFLDKSGKLVAEGCHLDAIATAVGVVVGPTIPIWPKCSSVSELARLEEEPKPFSLPRSEVYASESLLGNPLFGVQDAPKAPRIPAEPTGSRRILELEALVAELRRANHGLKEDNESMRTAMGRRTAHLREIFEIPEGAEVRAALEGAAARLKGLPVTDTEHELSRTRLAAIEMASSVNELADQRTDLEGQITELKAIITRLEGFRILLRNAVAVAAGTFDRNAEEFRRKNVLGKAARNSALCKDMQAALEQTKQPTVIVDKPANPHCRPGMKCGPVTEQKEGV